jgi:hypothetical protein
MFAVCFAPAGQQPQAPQVSTYLPPAGVDDLVLFVPDPKKTPALRAGTVNPASPYRFALPPKFREGKVANILSGNYCQVRAGVSGRISSSSGGIMQGAAWAVGLAC